MDAVAFLYTTLIIVCVACTIRWLSSEDRVSKYVNKIPGDTRWPLFGSTLPILLIPREKLFRAAKEFVDRTGTISRSWFGSTPVIHITIAEHVEPILRSSEHISKNFLYDQLGPWLGDGLLLSTGAKWSRQRKLITPTFRFKILDSFMEIFVEKSKLLTEQLLAEADGKVFDMYPHITHCALDIICETAMGVEMNAMSNKDNDYVKAIYEISEIILYRTIRPWLYPNFIFKNTNPGKQYHKHLATLHNFTDGVIRDRKCTKSPKQTTAFPENEDVLLGKKKRMAFLDLLMEGSGNTLSDREIREEVDTFMFEGHDTTTAAICWTLFLLGNHQEIQEEVYSEIVNLIQVEDKNLTANDLGELKLLERCIKESLRLYPSVPIIGRNIAEDLQIGGYLIPSGCSVMLHLYLIHKDARHFPEPDRFNPDRFLPENVKNRHPYAYVPFSAGLRNCIGQKFALYEEKTVLAYILRKFKIKAIEDQNTVIPVMDLILRPLNGLKVTLELRV